MAVKNRIEVLAAVIAALVPKVSNAEHITLLNDSINNSLDFRKDVIGSASPVGATLAISFLTNDLATATIAVSTAVTFSDIENGDTKYLAITKALTNEVTFSGAVDVSPRRDYITSDLTLVVYEVKNKNGNIYVNSINVDNDITAKVSAEISAWSGGVRTAYYELGDWNMDSTQTKNFDVITDLGLSYDKIIGYSAIIRGDVGSIYEENTIDFGIHQSSVNGYISMDRPGGPGTHRVKLSRITSGIFDSVSFDDTSFNRGWLIVDYLP